MAAPRRSRRPRRRPQRGAALLTAMVIVTLVVTLASSMLWQQWRAMQVEVAERARAQSAWILSGALDWARLILAEDRLTYTALTEPWAVPLAEARLSTFLAADKDNTDDGPEAFLSGTISDAQARYNLTNLVKLEGNEAKIVDFELATLVALCEAVGVSSEVAGLIATGMRDARWPDGGKPAAPLLPRNVAQLSWLGVDAGTIRLLEPYVVILPEPTRLNVNTAPREALAAIRGMDLANAERAVQVRQRTPFKELGDFVTQFPNVKSDESKPPKVEELITVKSEFFEVRGRLRLTDRVLDQRSLVHRSNKSVVVIERERQASRDTGG